MNDNQMSHYGKDCETLILADDWIDPCIMISSSANLELVDVNLKRLV